MKHRETQEKFLEKPVHLPGKGMMVSGGQEPHIPAKGSRVCVKPSQSSQDVLFALLRIRNYITSSNTYKYPLSGMCQVLFQALGECTTLSK